MRHLRLLILVVAIAAGLVVALDGAAGAHRAQAARERAYTAKVTYTETNGGHMKGQTVKGIQGRGTFALKLSPGATVVAAIVSAATGVPVAKIARGGSYVVRRDISARGVITGTIVTRFKAGGLGRVCLSFTEKPGQFVPGMSFVPMSGSAHVVGGTGAAGRWRGAFNFKQTSVDGLKTESFGAKGSGHASTGAARGFTAACRKVAAQH